jgi:hypothetical protein
MNWAILYVSIAAINHWDTPRRVNEIVSRLYCGRGSAKTTAMTSSILSEKTLKFLKSLRNIAYNLWSARWDKAKLMFCVARNGRKHLNKKK